MAPPAARPARAAARYRPGKALGGDGGASASGSGSESEEQHEARASAAAPLSSFAAAPQRSAGIVIQSGERPLDLSHVVVGKRAPQQPESESEYETDTDDDGPTQQQQAAARPVFRSAKERTAVKEESSEYETDSEEESSEEEAPARVLQKPVFVPKRARTTIAAPPEEAAETAAESKETLEAQRRRTEATELAAERIKREMLEKAAQEDLPDLDDTDGRDPDAEFSAWRLRELERLERERQRVREREEEQAEIERRRNMPAAQRDAEDMKRAEETRREKKKGSQGFMQKYYHKGAFFQDMDILKKYDFTEATEGTVDKSSLPSVLQVRDFGKRGRSKYTHLADQDTTRPREDARFRPAGASGSGSGSGAGGSGQGCFACGGPHLKRDCPGLGGSGGGRGADAATGANGAPRAAATREWGAAAPPVPSRYASGGVERGEKRPPSRERDGREKVPRWDGRAERERERERHRERDRERDREYERHRDR